MKYHQAKKEKHCDRISVLKKVEDKCDYSGVNYPASFEDFERFEENSKVAVFAYYIDDENSIRKEKNGNTDYITNDIIYLLRTENDEKAHFIYIKHVERLLNLHHYTVDKDKRFCPMCNGKTKFCEYDKHLKVCYQFCEEGSMLKLPKPESVMKFKNHKNKLERPFIVYADTECTLEKVFDKMGDLMKTKCVDILSMRIVIILYVHLIVQEISYGTLQILIVLNKW